VAQPAEHDCITVVTDPQPPDDVLITRNESRLIALEKLNLAKRRHKAVSAQKRLSAGIVTEESTGGTPQPVKAEA